MEQSGQAGVSGDSKPANRGAVEIFCSYSHSDEDFRRTLEKHLEGLRRAGYVRLWHDHRVDAGTEWEGEIDSHLNSSHIILLLISADFIASPYCMDVEMKRALERHERGEARVIPIILRPVDWQIGPFAKLQALPTGGRPVTQWHDHDEAFHNVALGIRRIIEGFRTGYVIGTNMALRSAIRVLANETTVQSAKAIRAGIPRRVLAYAAILFTLLVVGGAISWRSYRPKHQTIIKTNPADGLSYVWIAPGSYERGCPESVTNCNNDEKPLRRIRLDYGFWLSQTLVTVEAYHRLLQRMGTQPGTPPFPQNPRDPVVDLTWQEARDFCQASGGRLPFEAEWEYAAKAGESDPRAMGWFKGNSGGRTHTVATLPPNRWMIYDLFGDASEWCVDRYDPNYYSKSVALNPVGPEQGSERVIRGGSWRDSRVQSPASRRNHLPPESRSDSVGFRCVLP